MSGRVQLEAEHREGRGRPGGSSSSSTNSAALKKEIAVKLAANRMTKRRKQLNGKGVFDDNVNRTRAGVMLLCETDAKTGKGKRREHDQQALARLLGKGASEKSEQTKVEKLASALDQLHTSYVDESTAAVSEIRTKDKQDKLRQVLGPSAPSLSSTHQRHPEITTTPAKPYSTTTGKSSGVVAGPTIRKTSILDVESVRSTPHPETQGSSALTSPTTTTAPAHLLAVKPSAFPTKQKQIKSGDTQELESVGPPKSAAISGEKLTVSDWMQRNHEHQRYPEAEKDARAMLKRKDEAKRSGSSGVDRYTKPWLFNHKEEKDWENNAAKLSMERIFTPSSLADYRERPGASPAHTQTTESLLKTKDFTETMSTHDGLLRHGGMARKARQYYREGVNRELQEQQGMLSEGLQRELDPDATETREEDYESSNDGDAEDAFGVLGGNRDSDHSVVDELSYKHGSHSEMAEACNLIECTVVCLCEEANQQTRTGVTRDHAILRNILLSGLAAMYPHVMAENKRRNEDLSVKKQMQATVSKTPAPATYRYMRSWTKGVETLLLFDLGLSGVPFSIHNEEHLDLLVKYYCVLNKQKEERTTRLMERWKKNKDVEESLAFHTRTQRNTQQEEKQQHADSLLRFMQNSSAITGEDLSALDVGSANIKYRQREVAQAFLDRFEQYLPTTKREHAKADEQEKLKNEALDSMDPKPRYGSFDEAPKNAKSTLRLRHVLLQYVGLLNASSRLSAGGKLIAERSRSPASTAPDGKSPIEPSSPVPQVGNENSATLPPPSQDNEGGSSQSPTARAKVATPVPIPVPSLMGGTTVNENAITQFINVFKMTWSQTPLTSAVDISEATERNKIMEGNRVISLVELYLHLLSSHVRDNFRFRVKAERKRAQELERRLADEARAFSLVVKGTKGDSQPQTLEEKELAEKVSALHDIERKQLIEKYSQSSEDRERLARLKKAIESSEEWHGYNSLRHQSLDQLEGASPEGKSESPGVESPQAGSEAEKRQGTTGPDLQITKNAQQTRLEVVRIRKLQEMDKCWKQLKMPYASQIALHDKWNKAQVKAVDKALKIYKECLLAVEAREAAVKAVYENEKVTDAKERTIQRHQLFSAMCAAGQVCEVVARKLQLEAEDTLMYGDAVYLVKLKEDFNNVSKLLRS